MLQQILRDMYVDPEILAELDEDQKQTLFCKMREEQVRRWKAWNEKLGDDQAKPQNKNSKKNVSFREGIDGEPWVWVMGEHKDDKSIEAIMREEAIEKARKLAEKESVELRKQMEAQLLSDYIDLTPKIEEIEKPPKFEINDDADIYCSIDEIQKQIHQKPKSLDNYTLNSYQNRTTKFNFNNDNNRDVLQEITRNTQKVAQRIALWEKRFVNEKTCEIFQKIQRKQQQVAKEAEEEEKRKEQMWREQERKAKEAEQQIREIARRAREEHRLSTFQIDTSYSTVNSGVPPGRNAVLEWYRDKEKKRSAGLDNSNNVEPWFHGLITRQEAEKLLLDQQDGTYLVRLSEKIWGYAISYRAKDKCKHYLVNALPKYHFVGNSQMEHISLGELIKYHERQPLTGGETLKYACPRFSSSAIDELFEETKK